MRTVKQPHGGAIKLFEKGDKRPETAGRSPKVITQILKQLVEQGYESVKSHTVIDAYELLFGLEEDSIKKIAEDKTQPMLIKIVAKRMLEDDGFEIIDKMLDRAHGKAQQKVAINTLENINDKFADLSRALRVADSGSASNEPNGDTEPV